MKCPKCEEEGLLQLDPGIDTLQDDGNDISPEDTFVAIKYECKNCGEITMFFDYDRTQNNKSEILHENPLGKND